MIELVPVIAPQVDWPKLLSVANTVLGSSISESFDAAKIPLSPKAFIVSMNDLNQTKPALELDVASIRHLSYTFMTILMEGAYLALIEETRLIFTSSTTTRPGLRVAIISGNLLDWKEAVVCCSGSSNPDVKLFGNKVKQYFDQIGLSDLWKHYHRIQQSSTHIKYLRHA